MSEEHVRYVEGLKLGEAQQKVLLLHAQRADESGMVELSKNDIISETGINWTRVNRILQGLESAGHIVVVERGGTSRRSTLPNLVRVKLPGAEHEHSLDGRGMGEGSVNRK